MAVSYEGGIELLYNTDSQVMTKRTTIVLPDAIYEDLQEWAKEEGRPTANLVAFLVEHAIRIKYPEKYPSPKERNK